MIAFTFPGQGSQSPGMGAPWRDHPSWELVAEASAATGRDVAALLLEADADELTHTRNAQLATFVASMVVLDAVERIGVVPDRLAGHSLGEYSALTASGALAFDDGARLVAERGEAMQVAAEERTGIMAAVLGLDDDKVDIACHRVGGDVWVANFNAPGQVVVAGDPDAVAQACTLAKELGAKRSLAIQVGGAFHTPFMAPARDRLKKALLDVDLRDLDLPVVANVDAEPHSDRTEWVKLLAAQLCSPVRWRQTLHQLAGEGVTTFLELGPGKALTGMAKRTVDGARTVSIATPDDLDGLVQLLDGPPPSAAVHEGEHLHMVERMIVSPAAGVFEPLVEDTNVEVGQVVGTVAGTEVRSPFAGRIQSFLAVAGERVMARQPIAWLRTA